MLDAIVVTLWMVQILCWCILILPTVWPEEFGSFVMAQRGMSFREATENGSVGCSCELKCGKQKLDVQWKKTNQNCECAIIIMIMWRWHLKIGISSFRSLWAKHPVFFLLQKKGEEKKREKRCSIFHEKLEVWGPCYGFIKSCHWQRCHVLHLPLHLGVF